MRKHQLSELRTPLISVSARHLLASSVGDFQYGDTSTIDTVPVKIKIQFDESQSPFFFFNPHLQSDAPPPSSPSLTPLYNCS